MALDWPLSREEKKSRLLYLYDQDVKVLNDAQRFDELRIEVLRTELRAAHRRGDMPFQKPSGRRSLQEHQELPRTASGGCPEVLMRSPQDHVRRELGVERSADPAEGALDHLKQVFGFAKDAVDDGFAALGSLWRNAVQDDSGSDDGAYPTKPRARSEGARVRELAAPALKKPNSRRNSRGGPPMRVSFACADSDDEGRQEATRRSEEQEPMGEPEPMCSSDSPLKMDEQLVVDSPSIPRRELRMSLDVSGLGMEIESRGRARNKCLEQVADPSISNCSTAMSCGEPGSAKLSGQPSRRARLRGRMHGYSIRDAAEEE